MERKARIFEDCGCFTCQGHCECGDEERALRRIADGNYLYPSMTAKQREWCIAEADSAGEGAYRAEDLAQLPDKDLARTVLQAWTDYARSQGMY